MKLWHMAIAAGFILSAIAADIADKNFTDDNLFQQTRIWHVDLSFTPDSWTHLAPRDTGARGPAFLLAAPGTRNGLMGQAGLVFDWVHANLKIDGAEFHDVGVRDKGNDTYRAAVATNNKTSFKLDLNKYVKGQKLAKLDKINLHSDIEDSSYMTESIAYRLFRDAGVPAPRSAWAQVYITIAGKPRTYRGLYSLVEDVDSVFTNKWFHSTNGALLKPVTRTPFTYLGDDWADYNLMYAPKAELTADQKRRVIDFCKFVSNASDAEFAAKLGEFIDVDEFARFMAVLVWEVDTDSILYLGQNYYVWLDPKTNKFSFIPWDQDQSFDHVGGRMIEMSITRPWGGNNNRFLERVFANSTFRELYLKRLTEFGNSIFLPERLAAQVDQIGAAIRSAVKEESADGLAQFDAAVAGTAQKSRGGRGGPIQPIKSFAKLRAASVKQQLSALGR